MSTIFFKNLDHPEITIDRARRAAAICAVDACVDKNTKVVGIGTGSSIVYVVKRIAERFFSDPNLCELVCIPSSFQAKQLILDSRLPLAELDHYPSIDITIDGANEFDDNLTVISGFAGCIVQQKILALNAKKLVIVCDFTKMSKRLGKQWCMGIPIEVSPKSWLPVKKAIVRLYDGDPVLRTAKMKDGPIITDSGNVIIDWRFVENREYNWKEVNDTLTMIPGICETALFVDVVTMIYCCMPDGTVIVKHAVPRDKCQEQDI